MDVRLVVAKQAGAAWSGEHRVSDIGIIRYRLRTDPNVPTLGCSPQFAVGRVRTESRNAGVSICCSQIVEHLSLMVGHGVIAEYIVTEGPHIWQRPRCFAEAASIRHLISGCSESPHWALPGPGELFGPPGQCSFWRAVTVFALGFF